MKRRVEKGLENVVALESSITFIDGEKGILQYRGYDIEKLAHLTYDEVSYLLIHGKIPEDEELEYYSRTLKYERSIENDLIEVLGYCNFNIEAMDALRTVTSFMSYCDPDMNTNNTQANIRKGMRMIAKFPTIVTSFSRLKRGLKVIEPDFEISHGANFLYMLRGTRPTDLEARIIESDFILSADHELNPSTFVARTITSTLSDLHSAIIGGLCTLKGPLHGGARMAVMNMFDNIDSPKDAQSFVLDKIEKHEKLMGFGHRVYKT